MASDAEISDQVLAIVSSHSRGRNVALESEIYYDLKISGEDLFDLFGALVEKFEVSYSRLNAARIAPGEGGELIGSIACLLGFRPYRSFKVINLIDFTISQLRIS